MPLITRRLTPALLVLTLAIAAHPRAQQPPATLAAATAKLASGDAAGAAAILDELTAAEPKNGRAWRSLGAARQQLKEYAKAREAYVHALEAEPGMPAPLFNLGLIAALAGHPDEALEWLSKARATKQIDMSQIENAPALASLKNDPRFKALEPGPDDFAHPFVEDVTVLREWDGEAAGDQFGWIARNIGDVDGDGVPDIVTSAPSNSGGGNQAGRVYVYSTKTSKLLWKADGHAKDTLGTGIEAAGDTNRDGIPDVIASAPGGDYAIVYSGRDGHELLKLSAGSPGDQFGAHASGCGDVNGDGYADLIVGAPNNSAGGTHAGRAYVFSGKDGSVLLTLTGERAGDNFGDAVSGYSDATHHFLVVGAGKAGPQKTGRVYVYRDLTQTPAFTIDSDADGNALGAMFVSVLGDVDGDGVPDVYGSDWSNGANGSRQGRVYVHSGKDGHRLFTLSGQTAGEGFGTSPSPAGDVDGDGHADLIVGAWQYSGAAIGGGRAYLYSGKDGHLIRTYTNKTPGDTFGFDAVAMGDVNGDGQDYFLITSGWSAVHGFHSGRVFIISSGVKKASRPTLAAGDPFPLWSPGELDIHQIATGRGNAAFMMFPDGTTLLLDAGDAGPTEDAEPVPNGSRPPAEWIARYVRHMLQGRNAALDYAVFTHLHKDHIGAVPGVAADLAMTRVIDRGWPDYAYLTPPNDDFYLNYRKVTAAHAPAMSRAEAGSATQIVPVHDRTPAFEARITAVNDRVWTGHGDDTKIRFPALDSIRVPEDRPTENMCSISMRIRYGKFDYFTGGDMPGYPVPGAPAWHDEETDLARALGPIDVHVVNHHGSIEEENLFWLATLKSRVMIVPAWAATHPSPDVLKRMLSTRVYPEPRDIFITSFRAATKATIGARASQVASENGHVVIRVEPGGARYWVIVLDDTAETYRVKSVHGPYVAQ